jgi:hypothetical protein
MNNIRYQIQSSKGRRPYTPPKLGGVPASLASRRGGSFAEVPKSAALEPPRLAALGTPPDSGGEFALVAN